MEEERGHDDVEAAVVEGELGGQALDELDLHPGVVGLLLGAPEDARIGVDGRELGLGHVHLDGDRERARAAREVQHRLPVLHPRVLEQPPLEALLTGRQSDDRVVDARQRVEAKGWNELPAARRHGPGS